jgi:CheY-like chemotaxis protein
MLNDLPVGGGMGSLCTLLVEDEAVVREMVAEAFRDENFDVIEAATGDEAARELVGRNKIDVLFADVRMPGMRDGIDIAVRARELHPGIAVIVVSGYALELWERLERLNPPPVFLRKPFRLREALAAVRQLTP